MQDGGSQNKLANTPQLILHEGEDEETDFYLQGQQYPCNEDSKSDLNFDPSRCHQKQQQSKPVSSSAAKDRTSRRNSPSLSRPSKIHAMKPNFLSPTPEKNEPSTSKLNANQIMASESVPMTKIVKTSSNKLNISKFKTSESLPVTKIPKTSSNQLEIPSRLSKKNKSGKRHGGSSSPFGKLKNSESKSSAKVKNVPNKSHSSRGPSQTNHNRALGGSDQPRSPSPAPKTINKAVVGLVPRARPKRELSSNRLRDARPGFQGNRADVTSTAKTPSVETTRSSKMKRRKSPKREAGSPSSIILSDEMLDSDSELEPLSAADSDVSDESYSLVDTSSVELPSLAVNSEESSEGESIEEEEEEEKTSDQLPYKTLVVPDSNVRNEEDQISTPQTLSTTNQDDKPPPRTSISLPEETEESTVEQEPIIMPEIKQKKHSKGRSLTFDSKTSVLSSTTKVSATKSDNEISSNQCIDTEKRLLETYIRNIILDALMNRYCPKASAPLISHIRLMQVCYNLACVPLAQCEPYFECSQFFGAMDTRGLITEFCQAAAWIVRRSEPLERIERKERIVDPPNITYLVQIVGSSINNQEMASEGCTKRNWAPGSRRASYTPTSLSSKISTDIHKSRWGQTSSAHNHSVFSSNPCGVPSHFTSLCSHNQNIGDNIGSLFLFDIQQVDGCHKKMYMEKLKKLLTSISERSLLGMVAECNAPFQESMLDIPFDLIFTSCGKRLYKKAYYRNKTMREHLGKTLVERLVNFVLCYIGCLKLPVRLGKFVEIYDTHINIWPVGNGGSNKDYETFVHIDRRADVRLKFIKALTEQFKDTDLTFSLNGEQHIRVSPLGWDQGLTTTTLQHENFNEVIIFSPDRLPQIEETITSQKQGVAVKHVKSDKTCLEKSLEIVLSVL